MSLEKNLINIKGNKIDLNEISNHKLKRVIKQRIENKDKFMFFYKEKAPHTDYNRRQKREYSEYNDHHDHSDNHRDQHTDEGGSYQDYGAGPYHSEIHIDNFNRGHTDKHTDRGHSESTS
ncbi:hypothetical protein HOK51_05605 [Candidatus Woesearchaeota archaeon]|jgi:hypothetical protein|nr:hypothetical protein [Candidatus Woesearchaeota archaeon]MBT6519304.1 hypothetical protein [Candidatus Woesearchaeota archaeon]MBT7368957.1 hypothetical protein [Candidatus Woesearchaeota archaeon]